MREYIIESRYDTLNCTASKIMREEVIRCRDCAHARTYDDEDKPLPEGLLNCHGPMVTTWDDLYGCPKVNIVPDNGFCWQAEPRQG